MRAMPALREKRSLWLIGLIFLPVLVTVSYGAVILPLASAWPYLFLSVAVAAFGAAFANFFLSPETSLQPEENNRVPAENEEGWEYAITQQERQVRELENALEEKDQQILLWKDRYEKESVEREHLAREMSSLKSYFEREIQLKEEKIAEMQGRFDEWQLEMEKKQRYSGQLENKIRDLSYEIKTLLQLADIEEETDEIASTGIEPMIVQEERVLYAETAKSGSLLVQETVLRETRDAAALLRRSIDVAQKMTGSQYFGYRTSSLATHPYTLDLRHLFDRLRGETGGLVIVYSQKEERILFVNDFVQEWLGWIPEKFTQSFSQYVQEGMEEWTEALGQLALYKESEARLVLRDKEGEDLPVHCLLGLIPTGLFRGYVIGVIYSV